MAKRNARRKRQYKRTRRNPGLMLNRPRRRRYVRRRRGGAARRLQGFAANPRRRRHYKRNPGAGGMSIAGISLPPMDAVLFTAAGFVAPPIVSSFIMRFVPTSFQANQGVFWLVKAASAFVPPMLVKKMVNPRAGNLMLLGSVVSLAIDLIRTYAPGVIPGLGGQPFLGKYYGPMQGRSNQLGAYIQPRPMGLGASRVDSGIFSGVPERLDPGNRF